MIAQALAFFFAIHRPTPEKYFYVTLTFVNVALALWLAIRRGPWAFRIYMACSAAAGVIQGSPLWGMWGEVAVAATAGFCIAEILVLATRAVEGRERRWSRVTSAVFGLVGFSLLLMIAPDPWPNYPHELYYARIYTSAAYCATALGCWAFMRSQRKPVPLGALRHALIAAAWFAAILWVPVGMRRLSLDRWTVGISANLAQIACLAAWRLSPNLPRGFRERSAAYQSER